MIYIDETKWVNSNDARLNSAHQFNDTPVSAPTPAQPTPKLEKSGIICIFLLQNIYLEYSLELPHSYRL